MVDRKSTVQDKLGNPASWPSVPENFCPPSDKYLLAKLASASCYAGEVHVVLEADGQLFTNTFVMQSDVEAELIVARIQQKTGGLLIEAVNTPLDLD